MWLIVSLVAAIIVTAIWAYAPKKYRLDALSLMLWGLSLMILVDHVLGYEGEGPFLEMETEGLIPDGTILGIAMLIPVFVIWEIMMVMSVRKNKTIAR